jgi:hypothetical protein
LSTFFRSDTNILWSTFFGSVAQKFSSNFPGVLPIFFHQHFSGVLQYIFDNIFRECCLNFFVNIKCCQHFFSLIFFISVANIFLSTFLEVCLKKC